MEITFTDIKKVVRGYDCTEVDKRARVFSNDYMSLQEQHNSLISDYNVLKERLNESNLKLYEAEKKITDLEIENKHLNEEIVKLKEKYMFSTPSASATKMDDTVEGLVFIQ